MEGKDNISLSLPKYAFWDVSPEKLDVPTNKEFIISRIFERGKLDDVLSTIVYYGKDQAVKMTT